MSFFEIKNISCIRGNKLLFKNLNFKVFGRKILLIKGANGSGKTSLLKILCGLLKPTSGSIKFNLNGKKIKSKEEYLIHVDYIGHENAIKGALTVKENLIFYYKLRWKDKDPRSIKSDLKQNIQFVTEHFNLQNLLDIKVENLSSGEKRRVSLSKLYLGPVIKSIWFLDEPTNNLDKKNSGIFLKMLKDHTAYHDRLTIMTSHDDIKIKNKTTITL